MGWQNFIMAVLVQLFRLFYDVARHHMDSDEESCVSDVFTRTISVAVFHIYYSEGFPLALRE